MKLFAAVVALNLAFLASIAAPPSPEQAAASLARSAARASAAAGARVAPPAREPAGLPMVSADAPAPSRS